MVRFQCVNVMGLEDKRMISEAVELRLLRYYFEQSVDDSFYNELGETLVNHLASDWTRDEDEDDLVAIGIQ